MWFAIIAIVLVVVGLVAGLMVNSGAKQEDPKNEKPKDFEIPSSKIGVPIGVIFGTRRIEAPHLAWWGDLRIKKIPMTTGGAPSGGKKGGGGGKK